MSLRLALASVLAAGLLSAGLAGCVVVPVPVVVPLGGATPAGPVQALAPTPPVSPAVDQALNEIRAQAGTPPIRSNSGLDRVAAQYAADLAVGDKLLMGQPTGARAGARIAAAGVSSCTAGEVLSQGYGSATAALSAWLSNPAQRAVLTQARYANYGIGTAPDRAGRGADVWVIVLLQPCAA